MAVLSGHAPGCPRKAICNLCRRLLSCGARHTNATRRVGLVVPQHAKQPWLVVWVRSLGSVYATPSNAGVLSASQLNPMPISSAWQSFPRGAHELTAPSPHPPYQPIPFPPLMLAHHSLPAPDAPHCPFPTPTVAHHLLPAPTVAQHPLPALTVAHHPCVLPVRAVPCVGGEHGALLQAALGAGAVELAVVDGATAATEAGLQGPTEPVDLQDIQGPCQASTSSLLVTRAASWAGLGFWICP